MYYYMNGDYNSILITEWQLNIIFMNNIVNVLFTNHEYHESIIYCIVLVCK